MKHEGPKRRRFWIDAALQLRVIGFVVALLAGALLLAYLTLDRGLEQAAIQTQRVFIPVDWARESVRGPFAFTAAIILLGGAMLTLLWSHRMIGPLLVLTAGIRRIREGNLKVDLRIRDSDSLRDTIEDFVGMQHMLRRHVGEDRERLASVDQRIHHIASHVDAAHKKELEAIREELKKITGFFQV